MSKDTHGNTFVVGHFEYIDDTVAVVKELREKYFDAMQVFSPFPYHELEDVMYYKKKRSPVRYFALAGGITGCLGAFLMTCWMSQDYPMRTSAKEILSIPAFVVIAFECTILLTGISNLLSMFHFSRIPNISFLPNYRPQFSEGIFGVTVRVPKEKAEELKKNFEARGAKLVEVQYVR